MHLIAQGIREQVQRDNQNQVSYWWGVKVVVILWVWGTPWSVMVDMAPLLMSIYLMVFINTAIVLEIVSIVYKHYTACISLHKALGSKCNRIFKFRCCIGEDWKWLCYFEFGVHLWCYPGWALMAVEHFNVMVDLGSILMRISLMVLIDIAIDGNTYFCIIMLMLVNTTNL